MVKHKRRSEMSESAVARLDATKANVVKSVNSDNVNASGRRGIIKMTDRFGRPRKFYDHQILAAQHLWLKDRTTPLEQGRKAGLACFHKMGYGATQNYSNQRLTP